MPERDKVVGRAIGNHDVLDAVPVRIEDRRGLPPSFRAGPPVGSPLRSTGGVSVGILAASWNQLARAAPAKVPSADIASAAIANDLVITGPEPPSSKIQSTQPVSRVEVAVTAWSGSLRSDGRHCRRGRDTVRPARFGS